MATRGYRVNLELPVEFAEALRGMYTWYGTASPGLCATLAAAKDRGWTYVAIGNALGISRERVRQLASEAPAGPSPVAEIPDLPPRPAPEPHLIPKLTQDQVDQLRDLQRRSRAMGCRSADAPAVVAAHQFASLVNGYVRAGHRLADIASRLGVTYGALHFRLGRYGFRSLPPSQQHGPGGTSQFRAQTGGEL